MLKLLLKIVVAFMFVGAIPFVYAVKKNKEKVNSGVKGNQGNGGSPTAVPTNPQVPIDGGLSILLVAGAGLGAARVFKKNREEAQ